MSYGKVWGWFARRCAEWCTECEVRYTDSYQLSLHTTRYSMQIGDEYYADYLHTIRIAEVSISGVMQTLHIRRINNCIRHKC